MPRFKALPPSESSLEVIAVDLGYSARRRSCGLALHRGDLGADCTFGECIQRAADAIMALRPKSCVLVLEAVLSTRHDAATGNPIARCAAERGREWYRQPGVVTFAAALRFLDQLQRVLPPGPPANLAEALLSFKTERTGHGADAACIASQFWQVAPLDVPPDIEPASPHVSGVPPIRVFS